MKKWCEIVGYYCDQSTGSKYWDNITELFKKQKEKGQNKYGFSLEANPAEIAERLNHLEEELIDGLMYIEWIKEKLAEAKHD